MSRPAKSQLIYLLRMLEYCGKIRLYVKDFDNHNKFYKEKDQLYFNACLTLLVQTGEQATRLDAGIKEETNEIPWNLIKGFRNIAVHEYQFVDAEKVFHICTIHIPFLQHHLENFIISAVKTNKLSIMELQLSKGSEFYTHVRFENLPGF
jgi:uncharacterized protein with HEPN domain